MSDEQKDLLAPMELDLDLREVPVRLKDPATEQFCEYVLVELTGKLRDKWLNVLGARMKTGQSGNVAGVRNFEGIQSGLVAKSLFRVESTGERVPVKEDTIQAWPAPVIKQLFERVQDISALGKDAEDQEGND